MIRAGVAAMAAVVAFAALAGAAKAQSAVDTQAAYVSPQMGPIVQGSRVVLLPPLSSQPLVSKGEQAVLAALSQQLKAAGLQVSVLDESSYRSLLAAVEEAQGVAPGGPVANAAQARLRALPALAEEICAQTGCVAVLESRIVTRPMTVNQRFGEWDGVTRRLQFSRAVGNDFTFNGQATALSVALLGLSAQGQVLFRSYGGAAIPFEVDAAGMAAELRSDLFAQPAEVAEGVEVALRPLLQRVRRAASR